MNLTLDTFNDPTTFSATVLELLKSFQGDSKLALKAGDQLYEMAGEAFKAGQKGLAKKLGYLSEMCHEQMLMLTYIEGLSAPFPFNVEDSLKGLMYHKNRITEILLVLEVRG